MEPRFGGSFPVMSPHPESEFDDTDGAASDAVAARKKAMDFLARREYGNGELKAKLGRSGFNEETATAVVDQLARDGLQSDRRFVENFLQSRITQGKGPARIRLEMQQHGINESCINDCLQAVDCDWFALARKIRVRKFGAAQPGEFREKARQMRFLQYRGFDSEQIRRAMEPEEEE